MALINHSRGNYLFLFLCVISASSFVTLTNFDWELKKVDDNIEVYTKYIEDSSLKELKIIMDFPNTSPSQLVEVLSNTASFTDWLFKCSEAKTMEVLSMEERINYYKFDFPWPFSDRDLYTRSVTSFDNVNKKLIIETVGVPEYAPEKEDIVRVPEQYNRWELTINPDNSLDLIYYCKSDPGGSIPDALVNMAVDKGPTKTMKNLRLELKKAQYKNASVTWLGF